MSGEVGLINYKAVYLLPYIEDSSAHEDPSSPGFFKHERMIAAMSERDVASEIIRRRGVVLDIVAEKQKTQLFSKISKEYRKQFLQAVSFNVKAGMSAGKALGVVIESETGPNRSQLDNGLNILRAGGTFFDAIRVINILDETTLAIIEAGELTGSLGDALETAVKYQDARADEKKIMFGAVTWTAVDLIMSILGIFGNIFGMLPGAEDTMAKMAVGPERVQMAEALRIAYVVNYVLLAGTLVMAGGMIYTIVAYMSPDLNLRRQADKIVDQIPIFNEAVKHSAIANSMGVAHSLIRGGAAFSVVSNIAQRSTRTAMIQDYWHDAQTKMQNGDPIARALAQPILDNSERLIVNAHTNREQLAHAFSLIALRRSELASAAAKKFSMAAFMASMIYSAIAVVVTLWVTYLQYQAMMAATSNVGGGI